MRRTQRTRRNRDKKKGVDEEVGEEESDDDRENGSFDLGESCTDVWLQEVANILETQGLQSWTKYNGTANPHPPTSRMKPCKGQKGAIFPSLIWGGGGGSRLSIYFVQDCIDNV